MPRWFFILCVTALALSVIGAVLIVLRSPGDRPPPIAAPSAPLPRTDIGRQQ